MKKWFALTILVVFVFLPACRSIRTTPVESSPVPSATTLTTESSQAPSAAPTTENSNLSSATMQAPEPAAYNDLPPSELFDLPWAERSVFVSGLVPEAQHWANALPAASLYRIELTIPAEIDQLQGRQEIVYSNQETVALDEIVLRLFANTNGGAIAVSNLRINGQPAEGALESEESVLRIDLDEPLSPGEHLLLQLDFVLTIPREMGGNYGLFGFFSDVLMLDLCLPTIPVYDSKGWYAQSPPSQGDLSYYDASFYLVRVIAPQALVLATSGVEITREVTGDTQAVTIANGPARDFSLAASEKFIVDSESHRGVRVNSYAFPGDEEALALALQYALQAVESFSNGIGTYDYTEFDVAATPMLAGGIEYPGMTWINMDYYNLEETFFGMPASAMLEGVIAHEVGHHWFYNVVGNSQVSEAWLDESLVQYITGLYHLDQYGSQGYLNYKGGWYYRWERIDYRESPIGMESAAYDGYEYVAAVYGRGPFFFEALSELMGAKAFSTFLSDYASRFHWGIATGEELKQLAEVHCGCDLTDLFEEWVVPQGK